MPRVVANDKYTNMIFFFPEKKVVGKSFQIHSFIAADMFLEMSRIGGGAKNDAAKFLIKIVSKCKASDIFIIVHNRVDLRKNARVKNNVHCARLPCIFASNSSSDKASAGQRSSSASRFFASASPSSFS